MFQRTRWMIAIMALLTLLGATLSTGAQTAARGEPSDKPSSPADEGIVVTGMVSQFPAAADLAQVELAAAANMTEDFEGSWPTADWGVVDQSSIDGGDYLFGKRDCTPHSGRFAAWVVGGGAQGRNLACSADYPNNAYTAMKYGPFDLRNARNASLSFYLKGRAEGAPGCPYDYLAVGSSTDGVNFNVNRYCGDWTSGTGGNGFYRHTLDLSSRLGQQQVWIAFFFRSDNSIAYNGFSIDDVRIETNDTAPTSTPTVTATPSTGEIFTISGTVRDFDGTPMEGVLVSAPGQGGDIKVTNASGAYVLNVKAGTYAVNVFKVDYPSPPVRNVSVPPNRPGTDFTFPERFTIRGVVRDQNGAPLLDAVVSADPEGDITTTDAAGTYLLTVKAGTYNVRASRSGYRIPAAQTITVPPSRTEINFSLDPLNAATPTTTSTTTPTATNLPPPTATSTVMSTATPRPAPDFKIVYVPLVVKAAAPPAMAPTSIPTSTPTTNPQPGPFAVNGNWSGRTSLNSAIAFTIVEREVSFIRVAACSATFSANYYLGRPKVEGNQLLVESTQGFNFTVRGTFTSDTTASGTVEINNNFCTATATWTATRQ